MSATTPDPFTHTLPPPLMGNDIEADLAKAAKATKLKNYMTTYMIRTAHLQVSLDHLEGAAQTAAETCVGKLAQPAVTEEASYEETTEKLDAIIAGYYECIRVQNEGRFKVGAYCSSADSTRQCDWGLCCGVAKPKPVEATTDSEDTAGTSSSGSTTAATTESSVSEDLYVELCLDAITTTYNPLNIEGQDQFAIQEEWTFKCA